MRLEDAILARLERTARARKESKSALAERLIEEGLRMQRHPAIVFRDGPAGRRPGLAASGLDVWEIVRTVQPHDGDIAAAARYLSLPVWLVHAAMDYYAEFRDEIDEWIAENDRLADEAAQRSDG
jgi:hypothetical protein